MKSYPASFNNRLQKWNLRLFIELWVFSLIFYFFHFFWLSFSGYIGNLSFFSSISEFIGKALLATAPAILNPVLKLGLVNDGESIVLLNGFHVPYGFDLSGVKQMLIVLLVFLLISGSWYKKMWFIPLNLFILLVLVFFRFLVLTAHCSFHPEHFLILQEILFGPMFYFELIIMWIAWVLFIAKTGCGDFVMPDIMRRPRLVQPAKN
ncbi:MAG: hypothetical protein WCO93_09195 [bacterium]